MGNRVKGIVVEIGGDTTGLDKALSGTNKQISSTQNSLKDVERLLKLDPRNVNLLEQKQRLLAKATEETKSKLATLEEANKQVSESVKNYDAWKTAYDPIQKEIDSTKKKLTDLQAEQKQLEEVGESNSEAYAKITDEVQKTAKALQNLRKDAKAVNKEFGSPASPEQYDALQREIAATQQDLRKAEKAASDFEAELKQVDEKPVRDVEDAAEDAKGSLKKAGDQASNFGDVMKAQISADAIKGIGDSLKGVAEDSKEYRKIMASLDISSEKAGYTADQTSEAYTKLYGVLGDEQSAATTLANLQAVGLSQNELLGLVDSLVGAWAQYGDSIPIDGLAEAVNETIKTGQVTGVLADVLNWGTKAGETFGVTMKAATEENEAWNKSVEDAKTAEDYFNLSLQGCADETDRANKVLQMLANQGLADSGQAWQENNQSLVESNQAQAELQEQMAELGETVEPIFTAITKAISAVLGWFNSLDDGVQNTILIFGGIAIAIATLAPVVTGLGTLFGVLGGVMSFLAANPIVLIIAGVVAIVAAVIALWNKCEGFREFWINLWEHLKEAPKTLLRFFITIINHLIQGINWLIGAINKIAFDVPEWVPEIGGKSLGFNIPEIKELDLPALGCGGEVLRGSAVVGEAGPELLTVQPGRTIVQPLSNNSATHNSTNLGGVTITVYAAPNQDVRELAGVLMEEMQYAYESKVVAL